MTSLNSRILVISDLHVPYEHQDTLPFLRALKKKFNPTRIIQTGDEADYSAISYYDKNADLPSAGEELKLAIKHLKPIYALFPRVDVLESNHGSLIFRKALTHGLPRAMIRGYNDILQAPTGWKWHFDLTVTLSNGSKCYFHHSKGANAMKVSQGMAMSYVQGHHHSTFDIQYWANPTGLFFGMTCGFLGDSDSLSQAYAKNNLKRGIVGCAMIIDGLPQLIPMVLNNKGRWIGRL